MLHCVMSYVSRFFLISLGNLRYLSPCSLGLIAALSFILLPVPAAANDPLGPENRANPQNFPPELRVDTLYDADSKPFFDALWSKDAQYWLDDPGTLWRLIDLGHENVNYVLARLFDKNPDLIERLPQHWELLKELHRDRILQADFGKVGSSRLPHRLFVALEDTLIERLRIETRAILSGEITLADQYRELPFPILWGMEDSKDRASGRSHNFGGDRYNFGGDDHNFAHEVPNLLMATIQAAIQTANEPALNEVADMLMKLDSILPFKTHLLALSRYDKEPSHRDRDILLKVAKILRANPEHIADLHMPFMQVARDTKIDVLSEVGEIFRESPHLVDQLPTHWNEFADSLYHAIPPHEMKHPPLYNLGLIFRQNPKLAETHPQLFADFTESLRQALHSGIDSRLAIDAIGLNPPIAKALEADLMQVIREAPDFPNFKRTPGDLIDSRSERRRHTDGRGYDYKPLANIAEAFARNPELALHIPEVLMAVIKSREAGALNIIEDALFHLDSMLREKRYAAALLLPDHFLALMASDDPVTRAAIKFSLQNDQYFLDKLWLEIRDNPERLEFVMQNEFARRYFDNHLDKAVKYRLGQRALGLVARSAARSVHSTQAARATLSQVRATSDSEALRTMRASISKSCKTIAQKFAAAK